MDAFWADILNGAGQKYNVDPALLRTALGLESDGNVNTPDSATGNQGPFQISKLLQKKYGVTNPRDPVQSADAAAQYLSEGLDKTGSATGALGYYHAGPDAKQWGPKTNDYMARGAATYKMAGNSPQSPEDDQEYQNILKKSLIPTGAESAKAGASDTTADTEYQDILKKYLLPDQGSASAKSKKTSPELPVPPVPPNQVPASPQSSAVGQPPSDVTIPTMTIKPNTSQAQPGQYEIMLVPPGSSNAVGLPPVNLPQYGPLGNRTDIPPATQSDVQQTTDQRLGVAGIRNMLSGQPGDYQFGGLGAYLPIAHNDITNTNRIAIPQAINNLGNGVLDLLEGPTTGTVTNNARGVLSNMALGGRGLLGSDLGPISTSGPKELAASQFRSRNFAADETKSGNSPGATSDATPPRDSMFRSRDFAQPDAAKFADFNKSWADYSSKQSVPKPDDKPNSPATSKFTDMLVEFAHNKLAQGIGYGAAAALGGGGVAGFVGGMASPYILDVLRKMTPGVRQAVMDALKARVSGQRLGDTPSPTENKLSLPRNPLQPNVMPDAQWNKLQSMRKDGPIS